MPKIPHDEYEPIKVFVAAWFGLFPSPGLLSEHHPVAILEKLEKSSPARARLSLVTVIKDILEWASGFKASEIEAIDRDFSARGIITVSELLTRYSRKRRGNGRA